MITLRVYVRAFFVFGKQRQRRIHIVIHLPEPGALAVPARMAQKAQHIAQRLAQKQPDFMRKLSIVRHPPL